VNVVLDVLGAMAPNLAPQPAPALPLVSAPTREVNVQPEADKLAEVIVPLDGLQKTLNTMASLAAPGVQENVHELLPDVLAAPVEHAPVT
jgi:hypothetical protein